MFLLNLSNRIYFDTLKNAFTIQNVPIKSSLLPLSVSGNKEFTIQNVPIKS